MLNPPAAQPTKVPVPERIVRAFVSCSLALAVGALAAEPPPLMTTSGKLLVSEDFSGAELPKTFIFRGEPGAFTLAEGALQGVSKAGEAHAPYAAMRVPARDATVRFSAKFASSGLLALHIAGHSEMFGGDVNFLQLWIRPKQISMQQQRGSPESKQAQQVEKEKLRATGAKLPPPTAEQLADPRFYRTEQLGMKAVEFGVGGWHDVLFEMSGNGLVAQIDGQAALVAKATVADVRKSMMGFEIAGGATVLTDHVRIWENTRRADWEQVKASLAK